MLIKANNEIVYIVWALYDDAESSYQKAIKKYFDKQFIVYSIGINEPKKIKFKESNNYKYKQIDLSLTNDKLIEQLNELPRPDIILASPPCESWSIADCGGKMFSKISPTDDKQEICTWEVRNRKYYESYNSTCSANKKRSFLKKEIARILGVATIGATINIIETFKPKFWVIENPTTSKTWEFQKEHWNFNAHLTKTYYSAYDSNFSLKPTTFKSNIKLLLKAKKVPGNKEHMKKNNYSLRSSIPDELIKDIIEQIVVKLEAIKKSMNFKSIRK
ncbi:DNA methyltransferase [Mycoplasma yeatsii]|uniref:DNA methyltransferase n=1 Tax=Mycoplasma yeatsii TaxID=51365 RepID=UPI0005B2503C|nr:DNA methyltransferase [Mycoplasma yeatsii]AJM71546.1 C-5 cytosine-specific DNA methylase [Mycoplasma yeatsii GM274B]